MISKNQIKHIKSLQLKKNRINESQFVIEGEKMVNELLLSKMSVKCIFGTKNWIDLNISNLNSIDYHIVSDQELFVISNLKTPNNVLALVNVEISKFDYNNNEVFAGSIKDSSGQLIQPPFFKQAGSEVNPDSLRFNFDTKKAIIWNSKSEQSGMNVLALKTKKENDSVFFIKDGKSLHLKKNMIQNTILELEKVNLFPIIKLSLD